MFLLVKLNTFWRRYRMILRVFMLACFFKQPTYQTTNLPSNQPTKQPTNHPTKQTNKQTNKQLEINQDLLLVSLTGKPWKKWPSNVATFAPFQGFGERWDSRGFRQWKIWWFKHKATPKDAAWFILSSKWETLVVCWDYKGLTTTLL